MKPFIAGHEELVHDLAYATCSSDLHIKVFDKNENDVWELCDSWKAHDTTVVKVSWAGPEFGQIIASASHDATIKIFEEDPRQPKNSGKRWKRRAVLSEFRGALYDIAFAPSHLGLRLGSIGADGVFRVHEALDPNNLHYWATLDEIDLLTTPAARQLQSAFSLSWCPSMFFKEYIALSVLDDAFIYKRDPMGKLIKVGQLGGHKGLVRDIAWAPSMGRGFQLIATASKDGFLRIFKVTPKNLRLTNSLDLDVGEIPDEAPDPSTLDVDLLTKLNDHMGEVWRVSWNLTGTILASAGDDGKVRFWKASYSNEFQCMAIITAEQRAEEAIED